MSDRRPKLLEKLRHDVNSKCGSLVGAAALLPESAPDETREILALMARQAAELAKAVADVERDWDA
ncbi:MAG TPA: hypothetical protein VN915_02525 [Elusimicrobiota bacterium]|nr:hypothetical protein [Elusimicrobiota bacterium]